ncbi:DUF1176 domain-containing protein [Picosynechococcus sp. NKBG15041c]|uniref:DUF1176 domain-containing protein n=1 Tax=Picosynechococcus sp. NKBG15041c TaxID=1407650 RepID=UPI001F3D291D|nr:DUF1176 domain-containing protein [Picosynechococcus sp. NKBG15041c]
MGVVSCGDRPPETELSMPPVAEEADPGKIEQPIPVPAAPPPLVNSQTALSTQEAIAAYTSPDLSTEIIPELIENQTSLGLCPEFRFDAELTEAASNVYRVGENDYLVHLVCGSSAYQLLQDYFLYQKTTAQPDLTPLPVTYFYQNANGELTQETDTIMAGYSEYDPATKTISIFTKARGLGDCGSLGFYKFTGTELRLERFLMKNECDGNYIEPIDYPQVYP